jgi:hypothetical protein
MLGGAFIGVGFFARRKKEKSNEFSYWTELMLLY